MQQHKKKKKKENLPVFSPVSHKYWCLCCLMFVQPECNILVTIVPHVLSTGLCCGCIFNVPKVTEYEEAQYM